MKADLIPSVPKAGFNRCTIFHNYMSKTQLNPIRIGASRSRGVPPKKPRQCSNLFPRPIGVPKHCTGRPQWSATGQLGLLCDPCAHRERDKGRGMGCQIARISLKTIRKPFFIRFLNSPSSLRGRGPLHSFLTQLSPSNNFYPRITFTDPYRCSRHRYQIAHRVWTLYRP